MDARRFVPSPRRVRWVRGKLTGPRTQPAANPPPRLLPPPGVCRQIAVVKIDITPLRLRDEDPALHQLGLSLRVRQLEAITVAALPNGRFQLIAGERRVRAARLVGLTTLAAWVVTDRDLLTAQVHRWRAQQLTRRLSDAEQAASLHAIHDLIQASGRAEAWPTVETITGVSPLHRRRLARLRRLDPEAQGLLGRLGLSVVVVQPLLDLLARQLAAGEPTLPEAEQLRLLRALAAEPTAGHCYVLVERLVRDGVLDAPRALGQVAQGLTRWCRLGTSHVRAVRRAAPTLAVHERDQLAGELRAAIQALEGLYAQLTERPRAVRRQVALAPVPQAG